MATERSRDNDNTLLLTLALDYARQGWPVFPVQWITASGICSCNEGAACGGKSGKHPKTPKGFHDATLDEKQIRAWWRQWPQANIGGVTGQVSGRFVIDRDMKLESDASFAQLLADTCDLPLTLTHTTGSGGMHYIFRHPEGVAIASATGGSVGKYLDQYPGVDTRGDLGYIVLPPSRNRVGRYSVAMPHDLADLPLPFIDLFTAVRSQPQATAYVHNTPLASWPQSSHDTANYWVQRAVSKAVEGTRNETGMWLAVQLRDAQVSQSEAESAIHSYIAQVTTASSPFTERDIMPTLRNVYRTPARDPARSQTPTPIRAQVAPIAPLLPIAPPTPIRQPQHDDGPPVDDRDADETEDVPPTPIVLAVNDDYDMQLSCTDIGNAQRLITQHGKNIRYCTPWKKWLIWDGKRWAIDGAERIVGLAKKTVRSIFAEVAACDDDDDKGVEALTKWAKASANVNRIRAMITVAQPDCAISPDDLDQDPWLFNCANGTLDLKTGQLQPHRQSDNITKMSPVAYDPLARSELWENYFPMFFPNEPETVQYLQCMAGYAMTGMGDQKALFVFEGDGNNGKTTFVDAIMAAMGDYADVIEADTLMATKQQQMSNDIARMKGLRFCVASESEQGRYLAEGKVKHMTGGGRQIGELKYGEPFSFEPSATIALDTNYPPQVRGMDLAIWNRLKRIPFGVNLPLPTPENEHDGTQKADTKLKVTTKAPKELPGVLAWMMRGCLLFQRDGIADPPAVRASVSAYRAEMDISSHWIAQCCIVAKDCTASGKQLYTSYVQWCKETGERELSYIRLSRWMEKERKFIKEDPPRRDGQYWQGVGLLSDGLPPDEVVF